MVCDPCDSIQSFRALEKWCGNKDSGILMCLWAGAEPAIAQPGDNWRAAGWLESMSPKELNRRVLATSRWNR